MATTIKLKNSVTTTNAPSSLAQGEVAINITDKKVWVGNAATTPIQLLGDGGSVNFTTVDTTNLQVTNIKAKDGTASASIANSTGAFTVAAAFAANGGATLGDASGDALTINSSAVSIPNGLNFDSNTLVIDAANNNVGIGTSSPNAKLNILGSFGSQLIIQNTSTDSTNKGGTVNTAHYTNATSPLTIIGGFSTSTANETYIGGGWSSGTASTVISFWTAANNTTTTGTERMRINSSGNVGIGNTPTYSRLDVVDVKAGANFSGLTVWNNTSNATGVSSTINLPVFNGSSGGVIQEIGNSVDGYRLNIYQDQGSGVITFGTGGNNERMRITSTGNVGIGTSTITSGAGWTPTLVLSATSAALVVKGINSQENSFGTSNGLFIDCLGNSTGTNNNIIFRNTSTNSSFGATERMRIDSSGNVGIGTTSPLTSLNVVDSINNSYVGAFRGAGGSNIVALGTTSGGASIAGYTASFAATADLIINPLGGNLGLGVTPSAWYAGAKAFQFGGNGTLLNNANNATYLFHNAYYDVSFKYITSSQQASYYTQTNGRHEWYQAPSGTAGNAITFTQAMTLDASGNLLVGITSARANAGDVQVSKGISFPATQSAQSDANTLDDYEEGTFTPTISGTTTAGTATYTTQNGRYTKIGRMVQFEIHVVWSSGTGTGNLSVGGLPFTASNSLTYPAISGWYSNVALTANNVATAYVDNNTTKILIEQYPVGGGSTSAVAYDAAGSMLLAGCYSV